MPTEELITMKPEELEKALSDAATKAAEETSKKMEDTFEKQRQEFAQKTVPAIFKDMSNVAKIKMNNTDKYKVGTVIAAFGKANLENKHVKDVLIEIGKEPSEYFNTDRIAAVESTMKNMNTGTVEDGGALINEIFTPEFIPALTPMTVFRKNGIPTRPMLNGNLTYRKGTSSATAYVRGEAKKILKSAIKSEIHKLSSKFIDCMIVISDQELRYATLDVAAIIESQMMEQMALKEDYLIMYGTGTEYQPMGLYYGINSSFAVDMTGTPDSAKIKTDLTSCQKRLGAADVNVIKPLWVMHPNQYYDIKNRVDSNSNPMDYSRTLTESGQLLGAPVAQTTQCKMTGTTTYNTFYVDLSRVFIAEALQLSLEFNKGGQYWDGTQYVSGQVTKESTFICSLEEDIGIYYDNGYSIIKGVTWGN